MLRRGRTIAIALAVLVGAFALWFGLSSDDRPSTAAVVPVPPTAVHGPSGVPVEPTASPRRSDRSPAASPHPAEKQVLVDDGPAPAPAPKPDFGFVFGQVIDESGRPVEGRTVVFQRAPGVVIGARRQAVSDPDGHYRDKDEAKRWRDPPAAKLETGTWYVFCDEYDERVWLDSVSRRLMGTVEVFEDQLTHFDVTFQGGNTLTGRLDYDDPAATETGGTLLHLQLLSKWRPDDPVGDAVLEYAKGKPWFNVDLPEEEMRQKLAEVGKEYPKYELGAFKFSGLRAEPHVLRVILDVKGEWIWEREVDLSAGDVDLGGIPLDDSMFWKRVLPDDGTGIPSDAQAND